MLTKKSQKKINFLTRLFSLFFFLYILKKYNILPFWLSLKGIKLGYFFLGIILLNLVYVAKVFRWQLIISSLGMKSSFKEGYLMYLSALFLGIATPARIGEFSKYFYLKKKGLTSLKAFQANLIDKFLDIFLVLALTLVIFVSLLKASCLPYLKFLFFSSGLAFLLFLIVRKCYKKFITKIINTMRESFNNSQFWKIGFLTLLSWFIYIMTVYFFNLAFGLNLPFLLSAFFVLLAGMAVNLLPISVAGIGIRDYVCVTFFPYFNYSQSRGAVFSSIILLVYILTAFFGLIVINISRRQENCLPY